MALFGRKRGEPRNAYTVIHEVKYECWDCGAKWLKRFERWNTEPPIENTEVKCRCEPCHAEERLRYNASPLRMVPWDKWEAEAEHEMAANITAARERG